MQFAVKPGFIDDESYISFALRLAKRNGYLRLNGLLTQPIINQLVKNEKSALKAIDMLLPNSKPNNIQLVATPLLRKPLSLNPRVCISCIEEKGILPANNQDPFRYHCNEHNESLIDTCNQCGHTLTWDINLLDAKCTNLNCQSQLTRSPNRIDSELTRQEIADCILAGIFAQTPNKLYVQTKTWGTFSNLKTLIETGYELLMHPELMHKWLAESSAYFDDAYPTNFRTIPALLLCNQLKGLKWPAIELLSNADSYLAEPKTNTSNIAVHAETLIALTGIRFFELKRLQNQGFIHSSSGGKLMNSSIIDASPLLDAFTELPSNSSGEPLSSHRAAMSRSGTNIGAIIEAIATGQLKAGYDPNIDLLSSLSIEKKDLISFLQQKDKGAIQHKLTLKQAINITGLTQEVLKKLQNEGVISKPPWYQDGCRHFCVYEDIIKLQGEYGAVQYPLELEV